MSNIMGTLSKLYAVAVEAKRMTDYVKEGEHLSVNVDFLRTLVGDITDDEIFSAQNDLQSLLGILTKVTHDLHEMKVLTVTTSADTVNEVAWFNLQIQFGASVVMCNTAFDRDSAQSFYDGLGMALVMLDPEKNVLSEEGNA